MMHSDARISRRRLITAAAAGMVSVPALSLAANRPPLQLIVPYPAGGGVDVVARLVAEGLDKELGRTVIVENRAGAAGQIGASSVARAAADGNTLLVGSPGPITVSPSLYPSLSYNPQRDFVALGNMVRISCVLIARPDFPANNIKELLELARKQPGKLTFGSGGTGTSLHLAGELLNHLAGVQIMHVPYKGTAPGLADVMAGHIDLFMADPAALPLIKSHKVKLMGITSGKPTAAMPNYPLINSAVPGYEADNWYGVFGPAKLPAAEVAQFNKAINAVLAQPEISKKLLELGMLPDPVSQPAFAEFVLKDQEKWKAVIQAANITLG